MRFFILIFSSIRFLFKCQWCIVTVWIWAAASKPFKQTEHDKNSFSHSAKGYKSDLQIFHRSDCSAAETLNVGPWHYHALILYEQHMDVSSLLKSHVDRTHDAWWTHCSNHGYQTVRCPSVYLRFRFVWVVTSKTSYGTDRINWV